MTEEINKKPFKHIYEVLDGIDSKEPRNREVSYDLLDNPEKREKILDEAMKYVEQAYRFLEGAKYHDSCEAHFLGNISIDDFQQKLQILTFVYPESIGEAKSFLSDMKKEKQKVSDSLSSEPKEILEAENKGTLQEFYNSKLKESNTEDSFVGKYNHLNSPLSYTLN